MRNLIRGIIADFVFAVIFAYDSNGNVTNLVTSGNLTGEPGTQVAAHQTLYNSNQLPVVVIDAVGNSNVYRCHPVHPFLPEEIAAYSRAF